MLTPTEDSTSNTLNNTTKVNSPSSPTTASINKPGRRSTTPLPFSPLPGVGSTNTTPHASRFRSPSPDKLLSRRSPATTVRKVVVVLPFDSLQEIDWLSVTAAFACVRVIATAHLVEAENQGVLSSGDHDSTSVLSTDTPILQRVSELLDYATLCEISEDLCGTVVKYAAYTLQLYNAWASRNTDVQLAKYCAQECLRRLSVCVELIVLLVPTIAQLSGATEDGLVELASNLNSLFAILANPRWEEEDEMWASALHEQIENFVRPLVQVLVRYAHVQHRPDAPMPACLTHLCVCVDSLQRSVLWRTEAPYTLLLTLTESACNMTARLSERIAKFDPADSDPSVEANTSDSPYAGGVWSMREAMNKPPPPPTVDLPQSPRKLNRRASVGSMFGVDVTAEPGGSTQTPNAVNVSFNVATAAGPVVDETLRTQVLLQREMYSEDSLLHYVHENYSFFRSIECILDSLCILQCKIERKNRSKAHAAEGARQQSVGALTAFHAVLKVADGALVALCNGRVHVPDMLKVKFCSAVCS